MNELDHIREVHRRETARARAVFDLLAMIVLAMIVVFAEVCT